MKWGGAPPGDSGCPRCAHPSPARRGVCLVVFAVRPVMCAVESGKPVGYRGRLVVVAAAADSVSHPSHHHQHHADDEKDEPDDPQDVDFEQESGDEKDDSKDDHGVYLVSMQMWGEDNGKSGRAPGQCLKASFTLSPACLVLPLN